MITLKEGLFYKVETNTLGTTTETLIGFDLSSCSDNNFYLGYIREHGDNALEELGKVLPVDVWCVNTLANDPKDVVKRITITNATQRGEDRSNVDFFVHDKDDVNEVIRKEQHYSHLFSTKQLHYLNSRAIVPVMNVFETKCKTLTIEKEFAENIFKNLNIKVVSDGSK